MNPKPETESEQIKRMLEFWYGDSSRGGPGKPNANALGSSASSQQPTKESARKTDPSRDIEFSNETQTGISNSPQMKGLSCQLSKCARSMSDEVQDPILDEIEVHKEAMEPLAR